MGLDGGTIVSRSDHLRRSSDRLNKSNADSRSSRGGAVSTCRAYQEPTLDKETAWRVKWGTCALSEQPLRAPVVADRLGALYNREAVLEWLLSRRGAAADAAAVHRFANQIRANGAGLEHLASLRDVFAVDLGHGALQAATATGAGAGAAAAASGRDTGSGGSSGGDGGAPAYSCPVTGLPCGRYAMVALVPCGHVLSQRALDHLKPAARAGAVGKAHSGGIGKPATGLSLAAAAAGAQCPVCGAAFMPGEDDVTINGTDEQVAEMRRRTERHAARQQRDKEAAGGSSGKRKREKQPKQADGEQQEQGQQQLLSSHQQQQQPQGSASATVGQAEITGPPGAVQPTPPSGSRGNVHGSGKRVRIAFPEGMLAS